MIRRYLKRFTHAISGIMYAVKNDFGFRTQIYSVGVAIIIFIITTEPLTSTELLFVILAYFLILITELQNSALEIALNKLHPELHENIGRSKDMAAGAVLLAGLFLVVVISFMVLG
jgi:undecaprenol kinase